MGVCILILALIRKPIFCALPIFLKRSSINKEKSCLIYAPLSYFIFVQCKHARTLPINQSDAVYHLSRHLAHVPG